MVRYKIGMWYWEPLEANTEILCLDEKILNCKSITAERREGKIIKIIEFRGKPLKIFWKPDLLP